jgi:serine/threonine protein kinase
MGIPQGRCPHCLLQAAARETSALGGPAARFIPPSAESLDAQLEAFEVLELIGRGGMGAVYKAIHLRLDRVVAIKVLPPELAESDPAFGERFLREARSLARLQHPNLVVIYDFGEADGLFFIVMEYVEGKTLRQLIHGETLAPERTLQILPQICSGLRYMHSQGIIHRDIKPENILIGDDHRVRITDFGLARLIEPSGADISLTGSTHTPGTPHYMAPEQLQDPENVDHRADIFALGVVFYEMLTGHLPQGRFALPSAEASVGKKVDDVVLRSLEPDPEQRFQQADEVKEALEQPDSPPSGEHKNVKQDLSSGPLFPKAVDPIDKADLNHNNALMKAVVLGGVIALASLLPWGTMVMSSFGGQRLSWAFHNGSLSLPYLPDMPLWAITVLGVSLSGVAFCQMRGIWARNWKTLRRMAVGGFLFCTYGFLTSMGSWMNSFGSSDQTRSAPELTGSENSIFGAMAQGSFDPYLQPGPGVVLTTILFLYALRYFSKMLRLEKRLAESTKRERKRKRKQNENQAESA